MDRIVLPARRMLARATIRLSTAVLALAGFAPSAAGVPAQAVALVHAIRGSASSPAPIALNTVNWSASAGFGSRSPAWYKDRSGIVHLQGAARQVSAAGSLAGRLGTLPGAARPAANVFTIVHTFFGTYADLEIAANGQISLISPRPPLVTDYTFVSLEGITYRPSGKTSAIALDTPFWSGGAGFGSRSPAWYKDGYGIVHLQGAAKLTSGSTFDPLGTIPKPARPATNVFVIVHTFSGTYAVVDIGPDGVIFVDDPLPPAVEDLRFVSLEGISYRTAGAATAIKLNEANWSGNSGFFVPVPGWYKDRSGIVHLQGAAKQIVSTGTGADEMGTLPRSARPSHNVFTVVPTGAETYADLEIAANGQITLIAPRLTAEKDFSFVSLEGITYRR